MHLCRMKKCLPKEVIRNMKHNNANWLTVLDFQREDVILVE